MAAPVKEQNVQKSKRSKKYSQLRVKGLFFSMIIKYLPWFAWLMHICDHLHMLQKWEPPTWFTPNPQTHPLVLKRTSMGSLWMSRSWWRPARAPLQVGIVPQILWVLTVTRFKWRLPSANCPQLTWASWPEELCPQPRDDSQQGPVEVSQPPGLRVGTIPWWSLCSRATSGSGQAEGPETTSLLALSLLSPAPCLILSFS